MGGAALVTGGSRGIGHAVAGALAVDDHDLTLVARDPDALELAAAPLREGGRRVEIHPADLADPTAGAGAGVIDVHLAAHGRLDVLVLAAGMTRAATVGATDPARLRTLLGVNVESAFALVSAALPALRASRGLVVVVASIAGVAPEPGFAAYSATKAALVSMARSIALEEADAGVRACAICPAYVQTAMTTAVPLPPESMLRPDDVAEAVRFLTRLSPAASVTDLVLGRVGAGHLRP